MDASNLNKIESLLFSGTTENVELAKVLAESQGFDLSTFFDDVESIYYYLVKDDYDLLSREGRFCHVMNLTSLDIQNTFPIEHYFKYLPNITSLAFSEEHRFIFEKKDTLDLSLESFQAYSKFTHIEYLYIQNSILKEIPDWIFSFEQLKTLRLFTPKLTAIPASIEKLSSLESVSLSCKKELNLPKSLAKLNSLKHVNIRNGAVPMGLSHIPYIETLKIESPTNSLKKLKKLKGYSLEFSSQKGAKHFTAFSSFENVSINIQHNKIWKRQPHLTALKNVKSLTFYHSLKFPKAIGELKNLQQLHFTSAIIKKIPPKIKTLDKLESIYFDFCYLSPKALKELQQALPNTTINIDYPTETSNLQTSFSQLVVPEWWSDIIDHFSNYRHLKEHRFVWINSISFIVFVLTISYFLFFSFC